MLELVVNNELFESIRVSRPRINHLTLKHNGFAISDDAMIKSIEGTTASNPVIIEQEAEICKFCIFHPVILFLFFIVKEMLEMYSVMPSSKYEPRIIQCLVSGMEDYNQFIQLVKNTTKSCLCKLHFIE